MFGLAWYGRQGKFRFGVLRYVEVMFGMAGKVSCVKVRKGLERKVVVRQAR